MKRLKIALCKTSFLGPVSGADEILLNYAVHLHRAGHDVSVGLLYPPAADDQYLLRLQQAGVKVNAIIKRSYLFVVLRTLRNAFSSMLFLLFFLKHAPRPLRNLWQAVLTLMTRLHYRKCRSYFQRTRPDLLHVFTPDAGASWMIRAGHELGIPVLYHEMGTPQHMPMLTDYYRRLETVLPLCTEVAALSPRLATEWEVRFPFLMSVSVLPLIIELDNHRELPVRAETNGHGIVFGFAARVEEGKGPLVLLNALAQVLRTEPSAILKIAGIGPQLLEAKEVAGKLSLGAACEFVGNYSDPRGRTAFMNSVDVFVLPSLAEGTPNSMIEAMAHGLPIIATTVGGIPDIIDGVSGILVAPGDTAALANAMIKLAENRELRERMGVAAKERYQKLFSSKVVVPLMLETYKRVKNSGDNKASSDLTPGNLHPWTKKAYSPASV